MRTEFLSFSISRCIYGIYMIAKIFRSGNSLALRIPKELQPEEGEVEIEKDGESWNVSPVKPATWPKNFFSRIRLSNATPLRRPSQGKHRDFTW
jgi:virulence-associated protein VagC